MTPRTLVPAARVDSPIEPRALEYFFHRTAPQLAGFFDGAFFQSSVLHASLEEPAIRQTLAAIAIVHEGKTLNPVEGQSLGSTSPIQLYNKAIRGIVQKTMKEPNAVSLVAMISILFACLEYLRGNAAMSRSHITSGIQIFQSWMENKKSQNQSSGRDDTSIGSHFMETEIGPILLSLRTIVLDRDTAKNLRLLMNPVNVHGDLTLGDRFDTVQQARVGLVDLITQTNLRFDKLDKYCPLGPQYNEKASLIIKSVEKTFAQWDANFDDLALRRGSSWVKRQRPSINAVRLIKFDLSFGVRNYLADSECAWDAGRADFEEALSLIENLITDRDRFCPGNNFRPLSLDFAIIYCLHTLSWKCRWPRLRRWGLDLFRRICGREWLLDAEKYFIIFSRIMEIEEAGTNSSNQLELPDGGPQENILPHEHLRIHHFQVSVSNQASPSPEDPEQPTKYSVTFWSKPYGIDGPWHKLTEPLQPGASVAEESTIPSNLINEFFAKPPRIKELERLGQEIDLVIREGP
ncbi:hypothetical protein N7509_001195 [Penicillium cosmopolitanum]|uniref:Transcription factor domain-containing protein n=1 Tax=Penicillium cosmopolitanum TaxID=1131564 RepID=A0A9W9WC81_9EURO|nr:uncharacterized protein N7509_001195 [Penicillium cosmopolitanum]KAJ5414568.1 hypothetical protein N7509_001195 [Penicillium cosmopolitanum]